MLCCAVLCYVVANPTPSPQQQQQQQRQVEKILDVRDEEVFQIEDTTPQEEEEEAYIIITEPEPVSVSVSAGAGSSAGAGVVVVSANESKVKTEPVAMVMSSASSASSHPTPVSPAKPSSSSASDKVVAMDVDKDSLESASNPGQAQTEAEGQLVKTSSQTSLRSGDDQPVLDPETGEIVAMPSVTAVFRAPERCRKVIYTFMYSIYCPLLGIGYWVLVSGTHTHTHTNTHTHTHTRAQVSVVVLVLVPLFLYSPPRLPLFCFFTFQINQFPTILRYWTASVKTRTPLRSSIRWTPTCSRTTWK